MIAHRSPVSGVAVGPGNLIATAGYDNRLILWRGREAVASAQHDHLVNQCDFDATGTHLVSASSDYSARVWSVPELRLLAVLTDHEDDVEMSVFDPRGERIATACRDHRVRVFSKTGALLHRLEGHEADVISVTWAGDDQLISSSDDGTIRRWDTTRGRLLETLEVGTETDTVVVDPHGRTFAGSDDGQIIVATAAGTQRFSAHSSGVKRLAIDAAATTLVSAAYDGTLKLWKLAGSEQDSTAASAPALELKASTVLPQNAWARGVAIDAQGRVFVGTFGSSYARYDADTNSWDLDGVRDTPGLNAVHATGGSVFCVGDAGRVLQDGEEQTQLGSLCNFLTRWGPYVVAGGHLGRLFDARSGRVLYQHDTPLNCAAELHGGDLLVGTYRGEGLQLRRRGNDVTLVACIPLHNQAVKGVAVHGSRIFSVCASGSAAIHSLAPLTVQVIENAHDRIANGVTALPDGRFASVSRDRKLRLWTGATARVLASPHEHSIKCVAVSADGRWLGTGSYDGTVALYDLVADGWGPVFRPTTAGMSSLCAALEMNALLASSYDGCVHQIDEFGCAEYVPHSAPAALRAPGPLAASPHAPAQVLDLRLASASLSNSTTRQPSGSSNVRLLPTQ